MTAPKWLGDPLVTPIVAGILIEQWVVVAGLQVRDSITVERFEDGDVRFTSNAHTNPLHEFEIPAHWLPIVNEFLVRVEVSV